MAAPKIAMFTGATVVLIAGLGPAYGAYGAVADGNSLVRTQPGTGAATTSDVRLAQRIKIRPKLRLPKKRRRVPNRNRIPNRKNEKSGGTAGRIDDCDTKRGGKLECSSQASRLWDMFTGWWK